MKLSEVIERFIDLKIEGEPERSNWRSIDEDARRREEYHDDLKRLRDQIDAALENTK